MRRLAAVLLAIGAQAGDAEADILEGPVSTILSGDTIEVDGKQVRLLGIDAPEPAQTCWDSTGDSWPCGQKAALALAAKIAGARVTCDGMRRDREGRLIAVCRIGEENLNAWLVASGWALAYRAQSTAFVGAEDAAREAASGLWAGAFEPPWVWRTKH
jgi:endonuclease YncB( thermonuclease family)